MERVNCDILALEPPRERCLEDCLQATCFLHRASPFHSHTHPQDDLLSSLLESTVCLPPNTSPDNFTSLNFDLDPTHVLYPQNSPLTSDGYVSDSSTLHKASSPASCSTVSDQLGTSPVCDGTSPRHSPLVSSSVLEPPGTTEDIGTLLGLGDVMEPRLGNVMEPRLGDVMEPRLGDGMELRLGDGMEPRITSTAESLSRDVRIDVGEEH